MVLDLVSVDKNVTIFGLDNSSSVHTDNKKKTILVLSDDPTQRLDDNSIKAEAKYSINVTESGKRFEKIICHICCV